MTIWLWLICSILFLGTAVLLLSFLTKNTVTQENLKTLIEGFHAGLKGSGLKADKSRYPVELWVWETLDDDEVCEDCLERASWPPMDIADWMKEGLPRTPECETECGDHCRCQLVPYKPRKSSRPHHKS